MRLGTDHRQKQIVAGTCERCTAPDQILYLQESSDKLVCASCYRATTTGHEQECDNCGSTGNVWRDPVHRRNEYLCIRCHDPEHLFQNRWAAAGRVNQGWTLGLREKVQCALKDRGTECKGEVKWRSAMGMSACNKHAGKPGVGPNG